MSWTHLNDTKPKARKRYRCVLCDHFIAKGEIHVARRGIGDDGPCTARMHTLCESLTHDWDYTDWECYEPGAFRQEVEEHLAEIKQEGDTTA